MFKDSLKSAFDAWVADKISIGDKHYHEAMGILRSSQISLTVFDNATAEVMKSGNYSRKEGLTIASNLLRYGCNEDYNETVCPPEYLY